MPPLVSVLIPCYGQAHFLGAAIESALAQTQSPHEIIVIDDGSPDHVAEVVAAYPSIRLFRQENRGLSAARNRGLKECRGEFVVCLDADDRLLPKALATGVSAHVDHPGCAFVWGFLRPIDREGHPLRTQPRRFQGSAQYALLLRKNIVGPPVVVMFRRSVLDAVGGFSLSQHRSEDYELYLRIARTHDTWCHGELIAEYRVHGANMSRNSKAMLAGNLLALRQQERWVRNDPALRRALREGRRISREMYDASPRMEALSQDVRSGRWWKAAVGATILLYRYPRKFLAVVVRRVKRAIWPSRASGSLPAQ